MASTMRHEGVTEALFACMKRKGIAAGTQYDPPAGSRGRATTSVPIFGQVVLLYDHNPATQVMSFEIEKRPPAVPEAIIWARIADAIADCKP